jgi:hypothetical protein
MALDLASIPDAHDGPSGPVEHTAALRGLPATPSRRGFFRAVAFAGITVGSAALTVGSSLLPSKPAIAEVSPTGLTEWPRNDCTDAYPNGYTERSDESSSAYTYDGKACFGAPVTNTNCRWAWHKNPTTGRCQSGSSRNAWRWTVNGRVYRCSDGYASGTTTLTICRARVVP